MSSAAKIDSQGEREGQGGEEEARVKPDEAYSTRMGIFVVNFVVIFGRTSPD
jgi:hypothetical protein